MSLLEFLIINSAMLQEKLGIAKDHMENIYSRHLFTYNVKPKRKSSVRDMFQIFHKKYILFSLT